MLHILLLILKIIGIILLCILGILILTVLCLLFVPIRYRIEAVRKEGEGELPVMVHVKVTWLLHLLNVVVRYTGKLFIRIRVMIFPVYRSPKPERSAKKQKKREKRKKAEDRQEANEAGNDAENRAESTAPMPTNDTVAKQGDAVTAEEERSDSAEDAEEKNKSQKPSILDRLRAFFQKILAFLKKTLEAITNIQYTIRHFCDRMKAAWNAVEFRYEVLTSDRFKEAWKLCQTELGRILKHIRPKKIEADIVVGMDDPATTGEILAICGMLYPLIGSHVNVTGNFEKKCLEGRIFMKGRVSSFVLLWAAFRLYRNRNLKKIYGLLKKGDSVDG